MNLGLVQSLRLVRREMRTGLRGFGVFITCLFLGVFAISAIGSFSAAAHRGLLADAGSILGGDLEITLHHREMTAEQRSFLQTQGSLSQVVKLRTMAGVGGPSGPVLVELKAVDAGYPLYGKVELEPQQPLMQALRQQGALYGGVVEESFLNRTGLERGETIALGAIDVVINAVLRVEPDRSLRTFTLGPRILLSEPALAASGLVQPGSLVTHAYRVKLTEKGESEALQETLEKRWPQAGWRIRTWEDAAPRVTTILQRMNQNLTLLGLCALLVGGLGVSGAVKGYLSGKLYNIATLKCLGGSSSVLLRSYLLQVLFLGAVGSGLGLICGASVPWLLILFFRESLPLPLVAGLDFPLLLVTALYGLLIALAFSLPPLGSALRISPAVLLRGYSGDDLPPAQGAIRVAAWAAYLALGLLVLLTSGDKKLAAGFIAGTGLCFLLFRLSAAGVIFCARRLRRPRNPLWRLSLSNIIRPGAPAAGTLFSLGIGLTALVTIALVQGNLQQMVSETLPERAPAFFFMDIQPQQLPAFLDKIKGLPQVQDVEHYPTLRGRITAINDVPVADAQIAPQVQWAVRGDRFLSYSRQLPEGTEIVAGQWWPEDYGGEALISLTADLGEGFGLEIGDYLTVNILGREVRGKVASWREVDWSSLDLNFAILFSPGVLNAAPQTHIATVVLPRAGEAAIYRAVTQNFPNISVISTREVLLNVSRTLGRIALAFKGMALVTLLTGFLVLAGAVSADQHRRIQDAVIFKVCGATRTHILGAFAGEFALLGVVAGVLSAGIGSVAAWVISVKVMQANFHLQAGVIAVTLLAGLCVTLVLGLMGTWKALGQSPASYLRQD
jgi:putative ABC transport system permease protein